MNDKLKVLNPQPTKAGLKAEMKKLKRDLPEICDFQKVRAEITRTFYEYLLDQGFDKAEALQIVLKSVETGRVVA
jgi:hypothetical protein